MQIVGSSIVLGMGGHHAIRIQLIFFVEVSSFRLFVVLARGMGLINVCTRLYRNNSTAATEVAVATLAYIGYPRAGYVYKDMRENYEIETRVSQNE